MFIGHFAPALIAATQKDAPSLPVLFGAAQLIDWAFFALLLTGVEAMRITPGISVMNPLDLYHMPYTHSLLGAAVFAVVMGVFVGKMARRKSALAAGIITAMVVLSHWFLDLLVHIPDLTLTGHPPKMGLGLWNYPAIEMPLELVLIIGPLWFYATTQRPRRRPFLTLAAVMLVLQFYNWFGPETRDAGPLMSMMVFAAFALCTFAAHWTALSEARNPQ